MENNEDYLDYYALLLNYYAHHHSQRDLHVLDYYYYATITYTVTGGGDRCYAITILTMAIC